MASELGHRLLYGSGALLAGEVDTHVLALYKGDKPETMLVGRAEAARIECKIGYKTLCHIKARQLTFIYGGQLGDLSVENCTMLFNAIMASLRRGEADVAEFHFRRTDSPLYGLACGSAGSLRTGLCPVCSDPQEYHPSAGRGSVLRQVVGESAKESAVAGEENHPRIRGGRKEKMLSEA